MRLALFSFVVAALSIQQAVSIPLGKRAASNDTATLQFALTLEYLESAYYNFGLKKFSESDFTDAGYTPLVRRRFEEIFRHEQEHVTLLTTVLGDQAPKPCNYNFPITDVRTFTLLSKVFEEIGTSAYTGAIQFLSSKENIAVSSSILATEARQAAWVASSASNGVPWGGPFQTPLTTEQVSSLASSFITSCPPSNPSLGFTPLPPLEIDGSFPTNQTVPPGQKVKVQLVSPSNATHIAFLSGIGQSFVPIGPDSSVDIPENLSGQIYAIATTNGTELSDDTTASGPAVMVLDRSLNGTLTN